MSFSFSRTTSLTCDQSRVRCMAVESPTMPAPMITMSSFASGMGSVSGSPYTAKQDNGAPAPRSQHGALLQFDVESKVHRWSNAQPGEITRFGQQLMHACLLSQRLH